MSQAPNPGHGSSGYGAVNDYASYGCTPTGAVEDMTISSQSLKSVHRFRRAFGPPLFKYDQPECLISDFRDRSFNAAQNIVDLFTQAVDMCKNVRGAINDCRTHFNLTHDFTREAFLLVLSRRCGVDVTIEGTYPPKVVLPTSHSGDDVVLACKRFNEALEWCSQFVNDEKHKSLEEDLYLMKTYRHEADHLQRAVCELENYASFITDVKRQAVYFISEFSQTGQH